MFYGCKVKNEDFNILHTVMDGAFYKALTSALSLRESGTKATIHARIEYITLFNDYTIIPGTVQLFLDSNTT